MKAARSAIAVLSLVTLAACDGDMVQAPSGESSPVTVPVAFSKSSGTTATQTICSNPQTTELSFDGVLWGAAPSAGVLGAPYGAVLPGSGWVGPYLDSGSIAATKAGTYYFRNTFQLPAGATNVSLSGMVHADNWATFYLNGTKFFGQPASVQYAAFQDPPDLFSTNKGFVDGLNVVKTTLVNAGGLDNVPSSTALDYCLTVTYTVPEPASPSGGNNGGDSDKDHGKNNGGRDDEDDRGDDHGDRDKDHGDRDNDHGDRDNDRGGHDDHGGRDNDGGRHG